MNSSFHPKFERIILTCLISIYFLYGLTYILKNSNLINGERYYCLLDDAMISMRYAKNFVTQGKLAWNPGDIPVEGFSNPLWVGIMAFVHLLPLDTKLIPLVVQCINLALMSLALYWLFRIHRVLDNTSYLSAFLSILLMAFYNPLHYWTLQGMELALMIFISMITVLRRLQHDSCPDQVDTKTYFILGLSTFIRLDMFLLYMAVIMDHCLKAARGKKMAIFWRAVTIMFMFLLLQTILRYAYFHEVLPNTYYLKMTGFPIMERILTGMSVNAQFMSNCFWLVGLPLILLGYKRQKQYVLPVIIILIHIAYSIYTGGDYEENGGANRFICMAMPFLFIFISISLQKIILTLGHYLTLVTRHRVPIYLILGLVVLMAFNHFNTYSISELCLLKKNNESLKRNSILEQGIIMNQITAPTATIALVTAGTVPYFFERKYIDLLGKNDPIIARSLSHVVPAYNGTLYHPGHTKWNYAYSIGDLKPDIILQLWIPDEQTTLELKHLMKDYVLASFQKEHCDMYLLKHSKNITWDHPLLKNAVLTEIT